ncbi:hypothetical protein ACFY9F_03390 [Streptomyces sp. NPDC012421]|uniref:hypothetical protein n=1 Tax=Streptomyces sp. NPDC012421 TaxID=3364832 RepID=UPI0036ED4905
MSASDRSTPAAEKQETDEPGPEATEAEEAEAGAESGEADAGAEADEAGDEPGEEPGEEPAEPGEEVEEETGEQAGEESREEADEESGEAGEEAAEEPGDGMTPRQARRLRVAAASVLLVVMGVVLVIRLASRTSVLVVGVYGLAMILCGIVIELARNGRTRLATWLLVGGLGAALAFDWLILP